MLCACAGPVAEQVLLLENVSTSIRVGPEQLPSINRLLAEAASILQMEAPELYVRQHPVPNAYTLAIAGHKPFIVVHTALLELLSPSELQVGLGIKSFEPNKVTQWLGTVVASPPAWQGLAISVGSSRASISGNYNCKFHANNVQN